MMLAKRVSEDLLLDSEASLRLADGLIGDLRTEPPPAEEASTLPGLPDVLLRAYAEVSNVLASLRQARCALERTTVARLQRTHQKLREVSSVTENAATDMLDGLDRALGLVDQLGPDAADSDAAGKADVQARLRDELHQLVTCLQFQDITSQQLGYASSVLEEVEGRMTLVAQLLDASAEHDLIDPPVIAAPDEVRPFDPAASALNADRRQAVADEIFLFPGSGSD